MKKNFLTLFGLLLCTMLFAQPKTYQWARDISYTSSDDTYARERCKLDVYYPENATDCPVVVWFHGGGLTGGSKDIPMKLREKGMVVVGVNYRLLPKVDIATCIDDAAASVAWTFREISKYGGSTRKIFLSGHSAGGYLTTMLGLDKSWLAKYDIDADRLAGLIPFSGQMISHFSYRQMQGIPNLQPTIDRFAPLFHVRKDAPPLVLITGDRELELFGRYEENAYMRRMMLLVGHMQTTLYEIGGHDHGAMADPAFHILHQHVKKILEALPADTAQTVSILGDSYSTFYGHVTPRTNLCWYGVPGEKKENDVTTLEQTWWQLLLHRYGYRLDTNNSYSGATVCYTGYNGEDYSDRAFITRMADLGNPDIILLFGGTNDSWAGSPLGHYQYADWQKDDFYDFRPAFSYLLDYLITHYPHARIYNITNTELSDPVTQSMDRICRHYGVTNIRLHDIDKQWGHPSVKGMESICRQVGDVLSAAR